MLSESSVALYLILATFLFFALGRRLVPLFRKLELFSSPALNSGESNKPADKYSHRR